MDRQLTPTPEMSEADWHNIEEAERTWQAALVRIPIEPLNHITTRIESLDAHSISTEIKLPTVIYLHGCSGIWEGTLDRMEFLANNGYAVISPVSFARLKYPQSCDPNFHLSGMYRAILQIRQFDASHAINMAKQLSWVDQQNLFLMGFSEGGITTATLGNTQNSVNARIIEGWTCHSSWSEYHGINAPADEPILALIAENDPWFQNSSNQGDCHRYLNSSNGSKSVVFHQTELKYRHDLMHDNRVKTVVREFLKKQLK